MISILKKSKPKNKNTIKPLNPGGISLLKPETKQTKSKSKPKKKTTKPVVKKLTVPKTASGVTKDVMVEYNTASLKWSVRTAGSAKALKSFVTQKEAIEYGRMIAKNNMSELRIKAKGGKVRASSSHRK